MRCIKLTCAPRTGSIFVKASSVKPFTNSICSFSTSVYFAFIVATSKNAFGWNSVSIRSRRFFTKAESGRRLLPVGQPTPFATNDVQQSVAHRAKAAAQIPRELFIAERGGRL